MPTPTPHDDEPTQEIDRAIFAQWREARNNAAAWAVEALRLRKHLESMLGDAFAATVDGAKVLTNRPGSKYAAAAIQRDYPDLTQHFIVSRLVDELDVAAFAARHPDIAEKYRVRSFREVGSANATEE